MIISQRINNDQENGIYICFSCKILSKKEQKDFKEAYKTVFGDFTFSFKDMEEAEEFIETFKNQLKEQKGD
jgi:hypothetical protein